MGGEWQFTDFYDESNDRKQWELTQPKETPKLKNFTDITLLVDRSGSMSSIKESMETAISKFIEEHRVVPSTKLTLIQFNDSDDQHVMFLNVPIGAAEKVTINPSGGTPLQDAFAKAIDSTGRRLAGMLESERPDQVLFVVITDGQENASKLYSAQSVKDRVNKQSGAYNWKFVYLGANQDAFLEAAKYGIGHDWALNFNATKSGVIGSASAVMANTVTYTTSTGEDRDKLRGFTPEQRADSVAPESEWAKATTKTGAK